MNSASTVLRGASIQLRYGRNSVAPPGNQAENRENKPRPVASGGTRLLDTRTQKPLARKLFHLSDLERLLTKCGGLLKCS